MRRPLSPHEKSMLRLLAKQIREQDPELAGQLERPGVSAVSRMSPLRWPASVYLVIGVVLLAAALLLEVGSAAVGGLFSIGAAIFRSPSARSVVLMVVSAREGGSKRPIS